MSTISTNPKNLGLFFKENFLLVLVGLFIIAVCIVLLVVLGGAKEDTSFQYTMIMSQIMHSFCNTGVILVLIAVAVYIGITALKYLK